MAIHCAGCRQELTSAEAEGSRPACGGTDRDGGTDDPGEVIERADDGPPRSVLGAAVLAVLATGDGGRFGTDDLFIAVWVGVILTAVIAQVWNRERAAQGLALVNEAIERRPAGEYVLQARIAAVHVLI